MPRRTTLDSALLGLADHLHRLAKEHPSDFREHLEAELAGGSMELQELLFVASSLSAALHAHVVAQQEESEVLTCGFCGKTAYEVRTIVEGPVASICNECVDVCGQIIDHDRRSEDDGPSTGA